MGPCDAVTAERTRSACGGNLRGVLAGFLSVSGVAHTLRIDTPGMPPPSKRTSMRRALQARDAGLARISIATRVLVAASVAASGMFMALAAWAQPGRTTSGVSARQARAAASGSSASGYAGSAGGRRGYGDDQSLSPPTTLPVPSDQYPSPAVVSGAS